MRIIHPYNLQNYSISKIVVCNTSIPAWSTGKEIRVLLSHPNTCMPDIRLVFLHKENNYSIMDISAFPKSAITALSISMLSKYGGIFIKEFIK